MTSVGVNDGRSEDGLSLRFLQEDTWKPPLRFRHHKVEMHYPRYFNNSIFRAALISPEVT